MRVAFGDCELDTETQTLQREGRRIPIQSKAFDLLVYLIDRHDRVVSSDELLDALWPGLHVTPAALSTAVQKARHAVSDDGAHQTVIHTEHGKGFRFVAEVTDLSTPEAASSAPASSRARWIAAAGVVALSLAVGAVWFLNRPIGESTPIRSIAVLPIANLSGDPEQEYFSDGMTDALISNLAKIGALRVISRTSAMHYKNTRKTLPEIARELNVDALVEGSVIRSGERVRITAQLIAGSSERHLWSREYEKDLKNVLLLQSEVAQAIAREIRVALTPEDEARLAREHVVNPEAYAWTLKGWYYENRYRWAEARQAFRRAIEIDPNYAQAYAGLSVAYTDPVTWEQENPEQVLPQARVAARKALELDDSNFVAHLSVGNIAWIESDWLKAELAFRRAIELNPSSAGAHNDLGWILLELDRIDEAISEIDRARQLDPVNHTFNQNSVAIRKVAGRYEEALELGREMLELNPDFFLVRLQRAYVYLYAHRPEDAIAEAQTCLVQSAGALMDCTTPLGAALAAAGRVDEAVGLLRSHLESHPDDALAVSELAYAYTFSGRMDESIRWLTRHVDLYPETWSYLELVRHHLSLGDVAGAEHWLDQSGRLKPARAHVLFSRYLLQRYQGNDEKAMETARLLATDARRMDIGSLIYGWWSDLAWLRDLQRADPDAAQVAYARLYPELMANPPSLRVDNYSAAISLASLHQISGNEDRAALLLRELAAMKEALPASGLANYGMYDVMVHCLRGDTAGAMARLEKTIASGARRDWWLLRVDPIFEPLWGLAEFQALMTGLKAEMARQLASLRDTERNGELGPISENSGRFTDIAPRLARSIPTTFDWVSDGSRSASATPVRSLNPIWIPSTGRWIPVPPRRSPPRERL